VKRLRYVDIFIKFYAERFAEYRYSYAAYHFEVQESLSKPFEIIVHSLNLSV